MSRILCVAEKPSIAKAVATHLGGQPRPVSAFFLRLSGHFELALTFRIARCPRYSMGQELQIRL